MEKKYIGTLPKGLNPKSKGVTNGNLGVIYELKEDGLYHSSIGDKWNEGVIKHDLSLGYLKPLK